MFEIDGKTKLFAFDLDGTIYIGENAVKGAAELIHYLREKYQVVFFTNNSSKTRSQVHEKLNRLNIECRLEEAHSSSWATAVYLKETGIDNIYVIGSEGLRSELESQGLSLVDTDSAENLVVGLDSDLNYNKITTALSVLLNGGKFIACNVDGSFPVGENRFLPGCGAMVGAISVAASKRPDFIVGKPNTYILSIISKAFRVKPQEMVVVGDSYESDIVMAQNYNSQAILINAKGTPAQVDVPVMENLSKLLEYVRRS